MNESELARVAQYVARQVSAFPEVAGAYLYGSVLDELHAGSDIDVAVVLAPRSVEGLWDELELEVRIQRLLGNWEGHPFHVTALDPLQPLFSFRPIRDGRLVYVGDDTALTDFIEYVSRAYADLAPRHRRAVNEVLTP